MKEERGREEEKSLIVVVSDHGMTWQGNHGGPSNDETSAFVAFLAPGIASNYEREEREERKGEERREKERRRSVREVIGEQGMIKEIDEKENNLFEIRQVDIASTISSLFGIQIPSSNEGMIFPDVFFDKSIESLFLSFSKNVEQLERKRGERGGEGEGELGMLREETEKRYVDCLNCVYGRERREERGGERKERECGGVCREGVEKSIELIRSLQSLEGREGKREEERGGGEVLGLVVILVCVVGSGWCFFRGLKSLFSSCLFRKRFEKGLTDFLSFFFLIFSFFFFLFSLFLSPSFYFFPP